MAEDESIASTEMREMVESGNPDIPVSPHLPHTPLEDTPTIAPLPNTPLPSVPASPGPNQAEPGDAGMLPPLTYVDFLPQCLASSAIDGGEPAYAEFQSVVEQANQWLSSTQELGVVKCETIEHKVNSKDFTVETDSCLQHFSSHGNNSYVKGLRLWLMPQTSSLASPSQQLGYITVLPDHSSGSLQTALSSVTPSAMKTAASLLQNHVDPLNVTLDKLNHHLMLKPLPGQIVSVETLPFKAVESGRTDQLNTEKTLWSESGKGNRLFVFAIRIFYIVGQPAFEKIGFVDQVPELSQNEGGLGLRIKFAPFSQTVERAAGWLKNQTNLRVVNIQSVNLKTQRLGPNGPLNVNPTAAIYTEVPGLLEERYVKALRIFYVQRKQQEATALYGSTHLTTRLFVPTKKGGRSFESFSKNVQRVVTWLNATGSRVLGVESVQYPVSPDSQAEINHDRVDSVITPHSGHFYITCIRLYLAERFTEPPADLLPQTAEDSWGWGCVLS